MKLLIALFACLVAGQVEAQVTAGRLRDQCMGAEKLALGSTDAEATALAAGCYGYLAGYDNAAGIWQAYSKARPIYCIPNGVTNRQAAAVYVQYISSRPNRWNELAGVVLSDALIAAFPCK